MVAWTYGIRIGGLFRCCIQTVEEEMEERFEGPPREGERLTCRYCKLPTLIFRNGAWEWTQETG